MIQESYLQGKFSFQHIVLFRNRHRPVYNIIYNADIQGKIF